MVIRTPIPLRNAGTKSSAYTRPRLVVRDKAEAFEAIAPATSMAFSSDLRNI